MPKWEHRVDREDPGVTVVVTVALLEDPELVVADWIMRFGDSFISGLSGVLASTSEIR